MKKMIKVVFPFLLLPYFVFAADTENICERSWGKIDKQEGLSDFKSQECIFESTIPAHKKVALQIIKIKDNCLRHEGEGKGDCFLVRECGSNFEDLRVSPSVYRIKSFIQGICSKEHSTDYELLEADNFFNSKIKTQAYITCDKSNKTALKVTLKIGNKVKKCPFPYGAIK